MPNIDAIMKAVRGIDLLLPEGVEGWQRANDGWALPQHPLRNHEFWEGTHGKGLNKNYSAIGPDGRFVTTPCGVLLEGKVTALKACRVVVSDPLNPATPVETKDLTAGEVLTLKGSPGANTAYIVNGTRL